MSEPARRRMSGPERRSAIIEAATRTFAELGYRGATTADLAKAAGITQPMLYRHFASKHELFLAVLEQFVDPLIERWQSATDLFALGAAYLEFSTQNRDILRLRFHALAEAEDPAIRERLRQALQRLTDAVLAVVQRMRQDGRLPLHASDEAVAWLFSSLGQQIDVALLLGPTELRGAMQGGELFVRLLQSATTLGLAPTTPR